jgi:hypothetical protein
LTYSLPLFNTSIVLASFKAMPIRTVQSTLSSVLEVSLYTCDVCTSDESTGREGCERLRRLLCVKEDAQPRTKDDSAIRDSNGAGR